MWLEWKILVKELFSSYGTFKCVSGASNGFGSLRWMNCVKTCLLSRYSRLCLKQGSPLQSHRVSPHNHVLFQWCKADGFCPLSFSLCFLSCRGISSILPLSHPLTSYQSISQSFFGSLLFPIAGWSELNLALENDTDQLMCVLGPIRVISSRLARNNTPGLDSFFSFIFCPTNSELLPVPPSLLSLVLMFCWRRATLRATALFRH